jgi:hypothetical protein|nr:MAG TPA: hypothetical protein [Caudoviricetes sp.]
MTHDEAAAEYRKAAMAYNARRAAFVRGIPALKEITPVTLFNKAVLSGMDTQHLKEETRRLREYKDVTSFQPEMSVTADLSKAEVRFFNQLRQERIALLQEKLMDLHDRRMTATTRELMDIAQEETKITKIMENLPTLAAYGVTPQKGEITTREAALRSIQHNVSGLRPEGYYSADALKKRAVNLIQSIQRLENITGNNYGAIMDAIADSSDGKLLKFFTENPDIEEQLEELYEAIKEEVMGMVEVQKVAFHALTVVDNYFRG